MKNNSKKNYLIDNEEILYRCFWIAWRVFNDALNQFQMWHISNWIRDDRYDSTYLPRFSLYLSYSTEKILRRINNEIRIFHPNNKENWEFYISYSVAFSNAYKLFFEKYLDADDSYNQSYFDKLQDMLDGGVDYYNSEYEKYWDINPETDYTNDKNNVLWDSNYNTERLCVFHLNNITPVSDKERATLHLRLYKELGNPYYNDAFFNLSYSKIKSILWK